MKNPVNPYKGVNAHLHSYFQAEDGWTGFHASFIVALARDLNAHLPENFVVDVERSLQIKEIHPDTGERIRRPGPDMTIYQGQIASAEQSQDRAGIATLTQPILETFHENDELYYNAIMIYRVVDHKIYGSPVTQIEILSPSNKAGDGKEQYQNKRIAAIRSGLVLVEIDLLHESRSVVRGVPRYPKMSGSTAFSITVNNPHPSLDQGVSTTYGFGVDEPLPIIPVPLGSVSSIDLDFDAIYQDIYSSMNAYRLLVDLTQPPLNLHRYSPADQDSIQAVMERAALQADDSQPPRA